MRLDNLIALSFDIRIFLFVFFIGNYVLIEYEKVASHIEPGR